MKSKTHIYMANLLLEDLQKGKLALPQFGEFAPPLEIREAALKYPKAFRAGSIGPDFYPDMMLGQMVIHPESSGKWLTLMFDQYRRLALNDPDRPRILSFLAGFMLHYAGDMFGHDYVNSWAGGWFPDISEALTDPTKAKIIARHILVETYMDGKVPVNECMDLEIPVSFLMETFSSPAAMQLYEESDASMIPIYQFMLLKQSVHGYAQSNAAGILDIFNYFSSWENDIDSAYQAWIDAWAKTGAISIDESPHKITAIKTLFEHWFGHSFLSMIGFPDAIGETIAKIAEILDRLNILKPFKELFIKYYQDVLFMIVKSITGLPYTSVDEAIQALESIFSNPKLYINNGILFDGTDTSRKLDQDFGNFGRERNTLRQSFHAVYQCLNMSKLCLLGPDHLNTLISKGKGSIPNFYKKCQSLDCVKELRLEIKTSDSLFSGTDDNIYVAVIWQNDKKKECIHELLLDKPNYNDFEMGDHDSYRYALPERIALFDIKAFRFRKDYIKISDDWKPEYMKVYDPFGRLLYDIAIHKTFVGREHYTYNVTLKTNPAIQEIPIDHTIVSFLHSLDGKGHSNANPSTEKQWEDKGFPFYYDQNLKNTVFKALFTDPSPMPDAPDNPGGEPVR